VVHPAVHDPAARLLADGRYVTAGLKYVGPKPVRVRPSASPGSCRNGQPDTSFGGSGTVITPVVASRYDMPTVILAQSDGKILVAGHTTPEGGSWSRHVRDAIQHNGTLDTTFGSGGKVVLDFGTGTHAEVQDMTFGPGGTIYLAGMLDRGTGTTTVTSRSSG